MNVSLNPLPSALLESLRSIGYTLDTALADIIDNSITAQAKRISVRFLWNNGAPWVAICDDGLGMSLDDLTEAMRLGSRSPVETRKPDDLGRFGLGMKTASISQCRRMTVVSRQAKTTSACEWDLDALASSRTSEWNASFLGGDAISKDEVLANIISKHFADGRSGTILVWRNLDASFSNRREASGENHFSSNIIVNCMDKVSKEKRSAMMSGIRSRGNKATELRLIKIFREYRITGWRRNIGIFGKPDFVFPMERIAVFTDGCYWHRHEGCKFAYTPKSRLEFWLPKFERNIARDKFVTRTLRKAGWKIVRIWECDLSLRRSRRLAMRIQRILVSRRPGR